MSTKTRVLLVDDHVPLTLALSRYLERVGFEVEQVNESSRALAVAQAFQPHAMVLDYKMPDLNGAEVAWQFERDPVLKSVAILVCSGYAENISPTELPPRGIPIMPKPFDAAAVARWIRERVGVGA